MKATITLGNAKWPVIFFTALILFFAACKKDPPHSSNTQPHQIGSSHGELPPVDNCCLRGQVWELYASCDSASSNTILRSDTLDFSDTALDMQRKFRYNHVECRYSSYFNFDPYYHPTLTGDTANFAMDSTPWGHITTMTSITTMRSGQLSGLLFHNMEHAAIPVYLWMRRIH